MRTATISSPSCTRHDCHSDAGHMRSMRIRRLFWYLSSVVRSSPASQRSQRSCRPAGARRQQAERHGSTSRRHDGRLSPPGPRARRKRSAGAVAKVWAGRSRSHHIDQSDQDPGAVFVMSGGDGPLDGRRRGHAWRGLKAGRCAGSGITMAARARERDPVARGQLESCREAQQCRPRSTPSTGLDRVR